MTWAVVRGPFGARAFEDADFEWAVKAAEHEPGNTPCRRAEQIAVLWTMTNLWASGRMQEKFRDVLRSYCQPINVNQIGRRHSYDRTPSNPAGRVDPEERDRRIAANIARPLSWYVENKPETVDLVRRFMAGQIPLPASLVGVVDFAAHFVGCGSGETPRHVPEVNRCAGTEAFCLRNWSLNWNYDTVRIGEGSGWFGPVLALGLGVGATLVVLRRASRRRG